MLYFFRSEKGVGRCILRRSILILLAFAVQILLVDCRSTSFFKAPETIPGDRQRIFKPKPQEVNIVADIIEKQFRWIAIFIGIGTIFIILGIDHLENKYRALRAFINAKHDPRILTEFDNKDT